MKIQIINLMPLEYPYQVTRMKKQLADCELEYFTKDCAVWAESDAYILILRKVDETFQTWLSTTKISQSKMILVMPEHHPEYTCWSIPKAFEKEFDAEKLMTFLTCVLKENPDYHLFESIEMKTGKIHRDTSLKVCVDHLVKGKAEVHLLIKEKTKRFLEIETHRSDLDIHQHWMKGIEPQIDVLVMKRKS